MRVEDIELVVDEQLSEDPCFIVEVITTHGRLMVMGEIVVFSDHLVIEGMHVGGDVARRWGWSRLRRIGRLIAEKLDVGYIEIRGAVRTTGASPGRKPGRVRLARSR